MVSRRILRCNPDFSRLTGINIGSGWMKEVMKRIGGVLGCTHLVELLRPVATPAYQTQFEVRRKGAGASAYLNTCQSQLRGFKQVFQHVWPWCSGLHARPSPLSLTVSRDTRV